MTPQTLRHLQSRVRQDTPRLSMTAKHLSGIGDLDTRPHFLSEADSHDIVQRLGRFASGGGYTVAKIASIWLGNVRWARNQISTSGEKYDTMIDVYRNIRGAEGIDESNDTTDASLLAATRRAERIAALRPEEPNSDLITRLPLEPATTPNLFSEATYQLDADQRSAAAIALAERAAAAGMHSAGYIQIAAISMAMTDTLGRSRYFNYTNAQYSVTVRDPRGGGSGWAGDSTYDWHKIDPTALTTRALEKCLNAQNPVAIEPGRYTTILEPQAVSDFVGRMFRRNYMAYDTPIGRFMNEDSAGPFNKTEPKPPTKGYSMLGERMVDERITISADPLDPEAGFPPFLEWSWDSNADIDHFKRDVYHPVTWIEHGVLKNLAYDRDYAIYRLGLSTGLPNSGAFRMSGGETSVDEMIATTKRGLIVTRFDQIIELSLRSLLYRGFTRDGLWLIENGKISRPVKNLVFTESILFALNNVEQLGPPQRTFDPALQWTRLRLQPMPTIVPPLKIKDFSFTALADAV